MTAYRTLGSLDSTHPSVCKGSSQFESETLFGLSGAKPNRKMASCFSPQPWANPCSCNVMDKSTTLAGGMTRPNVLRKAFASACKPTPILSTAGDASMSANCSGNHSNAEYGGLTPSLAVCIDANEMSNTSPLFK